MRKSMRKSMHTLGAAFLISGAIVGPVSAVAKAEAVSSVRSSVESSSSSAARSSKSTVVLSKMSSKKGNNFAASSSSTTGASSDATPIGQTIITSTPRGASVDSSNQPTGSQGIEPHFHTANGDVVYCYNWQSQAPDVTNGVDYNQYNFYDGMGQVTGAKKADEVAAALEAGYHKDATTGQYEIAPQFQDIAQQSFDQAKKDAQGNDIDHTYGPLYGTMPSNETLAEFEEDVTQSVIWYLDGAPDTNDMTTSSDGTTTHTLQPGYLATHTALGQAILNYAQTHPLDNQTAYPKNVSVTANGKTVNDSNPLVMNPSTKESNPFTLSNYNGGVSVVNGLPSGYEIVDQNGNKVDQVQSGKTYRVKYVGSGDPSSNKANQVVGNIQAKANYESLKDSNYFSAVEKNDPVTNNPYQNMVNLETGTNNFQFPIIWTSSSSQASSSSAVSSKESSASSSSVKSSSSKVSSSSSKKSSSSSVKSSSSSTASSSSVASSSSSAKAVSSSKTVASSSKKAVASSSSAKKGVVVAAKSSSAKGQGEGHGHGLPDTGNAIEAGLAIIGAMMAAAGAFIAGFKRNKKQD